MKKAIIITTIGLIGFGLAASSAIAQAPAPAAHLHGTTATTTTKATVAHKKLGHKHGKVAKATVTAASFTAPTTGQRVYLAQSVTKKSAGTVCATKKKGKHCYKFVTVQQARKISPQSKLKLIEVSRVTHGGGGLQLTTVNARDLGVKKLDVKHDSIYTTKGQHRSLNNATVTLQKRM